MDIKDLESGKVYFWTFIGFCDWISEYDGINQRFHESLTFNHTNSGKNSLYIKANMSISNSSFTDGTLAKESLREATYEEIQWLNYCTDLRKWVPFNEFIECNKINLYYEIY